MTATVAVVGGGYGGVGVARALDDVADIVLVEPRDAFVHHNAALRALVDPDWTDRIFLPYDGLLARGRVVRDRAASVDRHGVTLASGDRIDADYVVLATGSAYPFPAKFDVDDQQTAVDQLNIAYQAVRDADTVLLLGAGPVGLELAGEITAAWPDKAVTIVDPADELIGGRFTDAFRAEMTRQLGERGIDLRLGTTLTEDPPSRPGQAASFTARTTDGGQIPADVWFRCYGVTPRSGYLAADLATARRADGHLDVTPELRLRGHDTVFVVGDLTAMPEPKMAAHAMKHGEVVAGNIRTLIDGGPHLTAYSPGDDAIALPLGPIGGATYSREYAPETGILGPEETSEIKGRDLMVGHFAGLFGLAPVS